MPGYGAGPRGGWTGPYITNELWCDLNAFVVATWANHPQLSERKCFDRWARLRGFDPGSRDILHRIAMLSADAIVRGRASLLTPIEAWWTRDQFISGEDMLLPTLEDIIRKDRTREVLAEKQESVALW